MFTILSVLEINISWTQNKRVVYSTGAYNIATLNFSSFPGATHSPSPRSSYSVGSEHATKSIFQCNICVWEMINWNSFISVDQKWSQILNITISAATVHRESLTASWYTSKTKHPSHDLNLDILRSTCCNTVTKTQNKKIVFFNSDPTLSLHFSLKQL